MNSEDGFPPYPDFLRIFNCHEHSQHLLFPRGYNKHYPNPLPQTAVLKKPEGSFWNVKWTISQDETISLQEGWKKFVKDNSLIDRDFLLFTYDGSRSFWVRHHRNGRIVKTSAPIKIQEILDDKDERTGDGDHHMEERDNLENMIISLSQGSSDEVGDDDTATSKVNKANGNSKKAGKAVRRNLADLQAYLDNPENPFFTTTQACSIGALIISRQVIKDYALEFGFTINLVDGFGKLKGKVAKREDRVAVHEWDKIYKRNNGKLGDIIICEIKCKKNVVHSIKVHFVKK